MGSNPTSSATKPLLRGHFTPHYTRAQDEARSLLREAFHAPADLQVLGDELHVRISS